MRQTCHACRARNSTGFGWSASQRILSLDKETLRVWTIFRTFKARIFFKSKPTHAVEIPQRLQNSISVASIALRNRRMQSKTIVATFPLPNAFSFPKKTGFCLNFTCAFLKICKIRSFLLPLRCRTRRTSCCYYRIACFCIFPHFGAFIRVPVVPVRA